MCYSLCKSLTSRKQSSSYLSDAGGEMLIGKMVKTMKRQVLKAVILLLETKDCEHRAIG